MKPTKILDCLNDFLYAGYEKGLFAHVNTHVIRPGGVNNMVTLGPAQSIGMIAPEGISLNEYLRLINEGRYSVILSDYSLLSIECTFTDDTISRHRYMYIPCPIASSLTGDRPDEIEIGDYLLQLDIADMKASLVSQGYLRFDYTLESPSKQETYHPFSHMTFISQHCRIGLRSPLSVAAFLQFVFDNFYQNGLDLWGKFESQLAVTYDDSLRDHERDRMHIHWL